MMLKSLVMIVLMGTAGARRSTSTFVPRIHQSTLDSMPSSSSATSKALSVRGGAGPLDPTDTAKLATILVGVQGALSIMSPSRTLEVYKQPSSDLMELATERQGVCLLAFALMAYKTIFKGADLPAAVGLSAVPLLLEQVKCFWHDDPTKLGFPAGPQVILLAIFGATIYGCLSGADYADTVVKAFSVFNVANGMALALAPEKATEGWGVPSEDGITGAMKTTGYMVSGLGVYQAALAWGVDPMKAFGYAWIPALIMQIEANFFSDKDVAKGLSMVWALIDAIVVLTCGVKMPGKGGGAATE